MGIKLNRKTRRNRGDWRRPSPTDTPKEQFAAFLKAPGKFHIVQLPDEKSFVVKVTDAEMPLFLTMCQQLKAVLGFCEAKGATPVNAEVASTQQVAESSAESTMRIRDARARQASAADSKPTVNVDDAATSANASTRSRQSGGRHAKHDPPTTFEQLAAGADDDESRRRLAATEIAAAQDAAARAQDALEAANENLREAFARGGQLHNEHVLSKFTQRAGDAIAEQADQMQPPTEHVDHTSELQQLQRFLTVALQRGDTAHAGYIRNQIFTLRTSAGMSPERSRSENPLAEATSRGHGSYAIAEQAEKPPPTEYRYEIADGPPLIPGIDVELGPRHSETTDGEYQIDCPRCEWVGFHTDHVVLAQMYATHAKADHAQP